MSHIKYSNHTIVIIHITIIKTIYEIHIANMLKSPYVVWRSMRLVYKRLSKKYMQKFILVCLEKGFEKRFKKSIIDLLIRGINIYRNIRRLQYKVK